MKITTTRLRSICAAPIRTCVVCVIGVLMLGQPVSAATDGPSAQVPVQSFELDNGMKFLVVERPEMATIAAAWVAKVGSADERPGITGLAHLFEHMMFKGTRTIGTTDVERDLDVIDQQEAIQEQIREIYAEQRLAWRRGEIESPYDAENRPERLIELNAEFDKLVEAQRAIMIKDEFDQVYTEAGATFMNAFTSNDVTVYINTVPANKSELWFWMESDRLLNPVFREFYSERDVVYEERRLRTESTPTGKFDEMVNSMFWQSHPYSWPIVGWPSDLRVISKAQADEFFDTYYAPNNLTAVLVGKITVDEAKALAQKYFGRIPRGEVDPPDVATLEMEQLAEKRMTGECDCQPQVEIRYHTVPFAHRDSYALDVLSGVLNDRTGRLYKAMIEGAEIASTARAAQEGGKWAGSFVFSAEAKGEATPGQLESAWGDVLRELQETAVGDEELRRVKNGFLADTFRSLENPFFVMIQLALYEGQGDWTYLNTLAEKTEAVTAEDVQRVANQYFDSKNRIVAQYFREEGTAPAEIPPELAELSAEEQQQVLGQVKQLMGVTDLSQLQAITAQVEAQMEQAPADGRPVLEYIVRQLKERIAELEAPSAQEEK